MGAPSFQASWMETFASDFGFDTLRNRLFLLSLEVSVAKLKQTEQK